MTAEELKDIIPAMRPQLVDLATRYLKDRSEAEDIVQDAMLKLWLIRAQMIGNVEAFARVMVRNMSLNRLRRLRRSYSLSDFEQMELADTVPTEEAETDVARLMSIVETLPDRQKTVLRLHDMEGMDYEDIAQLTGSSVMALRQMVSRSRRMVRLRYLAAVSAVVLAMAAMVFGLPRLHDYQLSRRYGGSYVIIAGQRNDNLREIRPQLESALAQAQAAEDAAGEQAFIRQAEAELLESISDQEERNRIEELLKD